MSQLRVKEAIISGAVLATSIAVRESIYAILRRLFPLPEDEVYANVVTAIITVILLVLILWIFSFYVTPEEKQQMEYKKYKKEYQERLAKLLEEQNQLKALMTLSNR